MLNFYLNFTILSLYFLEATVYKFKLTNDRLEYMLDNRWYEFCLAKRRVVVGKIKSGTNTNFFLYNHCFFLRRIFVHTNFFVAALFLCIDFVFVFVRRSVHMCYLLFVSLYDWIVQNICWTYLKLDL